tara:strand:+ start:502 stop:627 length:126 start_codon:yes stop_codon:yes gene_type:complete
MKTIKKFNIPNYPTRQAIQEFMGLAAIGFTGVVVILYSLIG